MSTCFVIQPFDGGRKYDKRFADVYKPAIEAAGLEAYRVDRDPGVSVPIDSVEKGIRQATICVADISEDNPNVWYELGFAFAAKRPVIMVCAEGRPKYPFDVQHRTIISYQSESSSDFDTLRIRLTEKIETLIQQGTGLQEIADASPVKPIEGLGQVEILVLAIVAGEIPSPDGAVFTNSARQDAERAGVTGVGFNVAVRKLLAKNLLGSISIDDESGHYSSPGLRVQEPGWDWIEGNESSFVLLKQVDRKRRGGLPDGDELPF
jgi:hypothetical protein